MSTSNSSTGRTTHPHQSHNWTRRTILHTSAAAAAGTAIGLPRNSFANPNGEEKNYLIHLDVETLADGEVTSWQNKGGLGGAFVSRDGSRPKVETIDGRKAVVFPGRHWLRSDFPLPNQLAGDKPFTVILWMYAIQQQHHGTMFTLGSRPQTSAEFNNNYGGELSSAAFNGFGSNLIGHKHGQPPIGEWHHIAYCYSGGENGRFQLFLNGELSGEIKATLRITAGQPCFLGSGFDTNNDSTHHPFHGAIAELKILDHPLNAREIRNAIGKYAAFGPSPTNLATIDDKDVTLRWKLGREGANPALFIASSEATLAQAQPRPLNTITVDPTTGECTFGPVPVNIGDQLFWRVDQSLGNQTDKGDIWQLQVSTGPATKPSPRNQITGVSHTLNQLTWQPGPHATAQLFFFGTTFDEVANATQPLTKFNAQTHSVTLNQPLEYGREYFWRIATENGKHPADAGQVWSFRTTDQHIKNNITFIVATDQHYGRDQNHIINHDVVNHINSLAGSKYPDNFGGDTVRTPVCVIAPGDLLDKGYDPNTAQARWDQWEADYGLDGTDGILAFPAFEGIGNHDGGPNNSIPRQKIRERNKLRMDKLTSVSDNGLHFSWGYDHIHIINTNLFPGNGPEDVMNVNPQAHDPEMALDFLKEDLAKNVGKSGKPVIVITHFGILGGMADWWTPEAKERFHDAIKDYNVIGIFNGHSHGASFIDWKGITTVHCGTTARPEYGHGDFMVVNVTETEMRVIHRTHDSWGINKTIPITTPAEFKA